MRELGKRDVIKNVARSMLSARLVQGITYALSTPAAELTTGASGAQATTSTASEVASKATADTIKTFGDYAQKAIIPK